MSISPSVTIITGYYKRPAVVERTLRALLDQSFKDIEIIVFDDASPDDTASKIREFVEKANDPRLVPVYHENNIGFVAGIIDAVGRAKGEYIAIQGSGDVSMPDRIELQKELLDNYPEVGIVGSYYENFIELTGVARLRTPNADETTRESLLQQNVFTHGEVMFRKSIYEKAGGYRPQFTFCQDYDLWLRMIGLCRFATVPRMLYRRYVDFEGVSYKPEKFLAQTRYSVLAKQLCILPQDEQEHILSGLDRSKLSEIVPLETPDVQKAVFLAAIRAIVWGNFDLSREIIQNYILAAPKRMVLQLVTRLAEMLPFAHSLMLRATGSRKESP